MLLVQESLLHMTIDEEFIKRFYVRFFDISPKMRILFGGSLESHSHKFQAAFEVFSGGAQNIESLKESLNKLGAYHFDKNVKPEYFQFFQQAILETLKEELGDFFTPEMKVAWEDYFKKIISYMREGMAAREADISNSLAGEKTMNDLNIIQEFKDAGAMLSGHFVLSSGLHSPTYLQCARVMMDAQRGERLCAALALRVREWMLATGQKIDVIVAPAMGGVVVGYEMGRQLAIDTMFCERVEGKFALRRGFELQEGQKVLIVEDVVTTGKSSMEAVACVQAQGAEAVAVASLIDRRGSNDVSLTLPLISLLKLDVPTYLPDNLPDELKDLPAIKPGSRDLKK